MRGKRETAGEPKVPVKAAGSDAERLWLLAIFLHLADTKSWPKTAKWMRRTTGNVRHKIAQLEATLDAKLVENDNSHTLTITPLGEQIGSECRGASLSLLAAWTHAERLAAKRQLLVATTGVGARFTLSEVLVRWSKRYGDVPVVVHVRSSRDVGSMLDKGEARFGLGRLEHFTNGDLVRIPHDGTTRVILVLSTAGLETAEEIDEKLGWAVPEAAETSIAILTRELGHAPNIRFTVGTHDDVVALVRKGLAAATLSDFFFSKELTSIPLRQWERPVFHGALAYHGPRAGLADYELYFLDCFKQVIDSQSTRAASNP